MFGRLKDGVSIAQAQAKLDTIAARLGQQYPKTNAGHGVSVKNTVEDLTVRDATVSDDADGRSCVCSSAGVCQCGEPATGPCFRTAKRNRAAGRARGQPLASRTAVAGGKRAACPARKRWSPPAIGVGHQSSTPQPSSISSSSMLQGLKHLQLDLRVFWFTLLLAVITGIIAGLAPAWHFSRPNVNDTLKEGARGGSASESGQTASYRAGDFRDCAFSGSARGRGFDGEGIPYPHHQGHGV